MKFQAGRGVGNTEPQRIEALEAKLAAAVNDIRIARSIWTERKINGKLTPVQAGDAVARLLTEAITALTSVEEGRNDG